MLCYSRHQARWKLSKIFCFCWLCYSSRPFASRCVWCMIQEIIVFLHEIIKGYWTGFVLLHRYCPIRNLIIKPPEVISLSNSFFIIAYQALSQNWDFKAEVGGTSQFPTPRLPLTLHFGFGKSIGHIKTREQRMTFEIILPWAWLKK